MDALTFLESHTAQRSETNGWAESLVLPVEDGTAIALVQSGRPEECCDCAMEYYIGT